MRDEVHVAGADSDTQHESLDVRRVAVVEIRGLLSPHRRAQRVARRVEDGHEPVAGALDHRALIAADGLAEYGVERDRKPIGCIVAERGSLRCGTDQVAEQHS
jgi:hypothetical protein